MFLLCLSEYVSHVVSVCVFLSHCAALCTFLSHCATLSKFLSCCASHSVLLSPYPLTTWFSYCVCFQVARYGFCIDTEEYPRTSLKMGVCVGSSDYDDASGERCVKHRPSFGEIAYCLCSVRLTLLVPGLESSVMCMCVHVARALTASRQSSAFLQSVCSCVHMQRAHT